MIMNEKIKQAIFNSIEEINQQLENKDQLEKNIETVLFGENGVLDSLGLINLVVAVEQSIEDEFDVTITLADERAMSQQTSPFRTVGTMTDYIEILLGEKLNG
jgi:D-alanine--poly(phosphoribitol) ligase subunit 2